MGRSVLTRAFRNTAPIDVSNRRAFGSVRSGVAPPQDIATQLSAMSAVGTLFAVVDLLANATAQVEWRLYRKRGGGQDPMDRQEVERHPAKVVWDRPNQHYTQRQFVEAVTQHRDLTGEMWWVVGRGKQAGPAGTPLELWPVRPDRMRPVADAEAFISGYVYRGLQDVPLGLTDVIYAHRMNPLDPYRGISPVGPLLNDIRGDQAASAWNANFFQNSARPDGVIEVDEALSDSEFDQMTHRWREQHQGTANAHRVAVLERATFKPMGWSMKDMDFVSLRGWSGDQIRQAYGVSKFMLGGHEGVNRATALAAKAVFYEQSIHPRLDVIREALNTQFLPLFGGLGQDVEFDYCAPEPEDEEDERAELASKIAAVVALIGAGFDPVETLAAFGLPELALAAQPVAPTPAAPPPATDNGADNEPPT